MSLNPNPVRGMTGQNPAVNFEGDRRLAMHHSIPAYHEGVLLPMWAAKLMGAPLKILDPKTIVAQYTLPKT